MIFFKIVNFFHFFAYSLWQQVCYARKSPWAVPFCSDTSLKSELGYQCLIFWVFDHYGQFQNGRRKIHDFSWNVSSIMFFSNFTSQSQFWYLILHFNARLSIYKCCNVIFTTESKMAARKWWRKCSKFHFFANSLWAQVLMVYEPLWAVSFHWETRTHEQKSGDYCLMCWIIYNYGIFQIVAVK